MGSFTKRLAAVAAIAFAGIWMGAAGDQHHSHSHAELGHQAPDFTLTDSNGKTHTLSEYTKSGKIVVLEWYNSGCPFVVRHHDQYNTMDDLYGEFSEQNVVFLAVNSTNENHRDYGLDVESIKKWSKRAPVLMDASGKVGAMFNAKTTPHMFVIDAKGTLAYTGAIDDDPRDDKSAESKTNYVRQALTELIASESVSIPKTKSYGCGVKYAR